MARPTTVHLKYTSKELLSYVNDPNSCVRRLTDRLHIGLLPAGLANFKEAVVDTVNREQIGRFDAKHDGIVLDVRNIKVLGNSFAIHTDHPELHIDLLADLHVFRPTVGAVIRGVIKHIAKGHISVTIHRVFNVAIRLAGTKKGLQVNAEITIKVTRFDLKDTIPYIEGELDESSLVLPGALKKSRTEVGKKTKLESDDSDGSDSQDDNRSVMVDSRVVVKSEPRSDHSDSDTSANDSDPDSQSEDRRRAPNVHSTDDDDDDDDDASEPEVPSPMVVHIKQEKLSTPLPSDSSDSGTEAPARFPTKSSATASVKPRPIIKRESNTTTSDSSDSEPTVPAPAIIKREPSVTSKRPSLAAKPVKPDTPIVRKPKSRTESLLQRMISEKIDAVIRESDSELTPVRSSSKRRSTVALDDSLQLDETAFASPALSSTMLPGKVKRSKKSK